MALRQMPSRLINPRGDLSPRQNSGSELMAAIRALKENRRGVVRGPQNRTPIRELERGLEYDPGSLSQGITRGEVLELLTSFGFRRAFPTPIRTDNDASAASVTISTAGGFEPGMGVLVIQQSTGVAVGAVPVHTKAHLGAWTMDGVSLFDGQAVPFFPANGGQVSFFTLDRGGLTLGGTVTCSFPAADVGVVVTSIFADASEAESLASMLIG